MHELAVCQALMQQVEQVANEHKASSVKRIQLRIGPLSGVEPNLLRQAFSFVQASTVAEGATLEITHSAVKLICQDCDKESEVSPNHLLCEFCGSYRTRIVSGDEMLLESVELDFSETSMPRTASA